MIRLIGTIETCSFADERLFFKHERMDLDFSKVGHLENSMTSTYGSSENPETATTWDDTPILPFPTD